MAVVFDSRDIVAVLGFKFQCRCSFILKGTGPADFVDEPKSVDLDPY